MRRLWQGAWVITMFLVGVTQAITITVDDNNTAIEYRGTWVHKTLRGPVEADFERSIMFTNTSGSTATYTFQGTGIALYGMSQTVDTSNVNSTYSIDGGKTIHFSPVKSTVSAKYRQKLFESDTLSDEGHTIVITIAGEDFSLNYLVVTQSPPSTATTISIPETRLGSMTEPSLPTYRATASSAARGAPQSQISIVASVTASPINTSTYSHSTKFPAGEIAGFSIAGILVIVMVGLVGYTHHRNAGRIRRQDGVTPYDPGLTTLSLETLEKQDLVREDKSRGCTADAVLSLFEFAPAYPQSTVPVTSKRPRECRELCDVRMADFCGTNMSRDRRTVFEPPSGSPLAASQSILQHPQRARFKGAPSSVGLIRDVVQCGERRRSMDGGVRLAGGPLDDGWQNDSSFDDQEDMGSGVSTLPPAYQLYASS